MVSDFKFQESITMKINGKTFFFTHGHKYNINNIPDNIDVMIYGHLHMGFIQEKDKVLCANSGSISLPKKNTKHNYLIIRYRWKIIDRKTYVN